jgi:hypothetical protein
VSCWGFNGSGQLGNGGITNSSVPVAVVGMSNGVTAISVGASHSCALQGGGAWCWGENSTGELGNGSVTDSSLPIAVTGLGSSVATISAGQPHTCAVTDAGHACWGYNATGQLGDGTLTGPVFCNGGFKCHVTPTSVLLADTDSDGVTDAADNCPSVANGGSEAAIIGLGNQTDTDADGSGDACDADDDGDAVMDVLDNCQFIPNSTQANNDVLGGPFGGSPAWIADGSTSEGDSTGGDPCDPNDDNNGCDDSDEAGLTPARDPLNPWDFADMWVPALPATSPAAGNRNGAITLADASAAIIWVGTVNNGGANSYLRDYDADVNANGVEDGAEYDRAPGLAMGVSGPPNGAVTLADISVILAQVGDVC